MTRDEILNMPAGREMDALIAEHVFGWRRAVRWSGSEEVSCLVHPTDGNYLPDEFSRWSIDILAAWEVVEKMAEKFKCDISVGIKSSGGNDPSIYVCRIQYGTLYYDTPSLTLSIGADSAPLAICRAALLAVMK